MNTFMGGFRLVSGVMKISDPLLATKRIVKDMEVGRYEVEASFDGYQHIQKLWIMKAGMRPIKCRWDEAGSVCVDSGVLTAIDLTCTTWTDKDIGPYLDKQKPASLMDIFLSHISGPVACGTFSHGCVARVNDGGHVIEIGQFKGKTVGVAITFGEK